MSPSGSKPGLSRGASTARGHPTVIGGCGFGGAAEAPGQSRTHRQNPPTSLTRVANP